MNNEKLYELWKQRKKETIVSQGFGRKVMNRICQHEEQKRPHVNVKELFEQIFARRLAKAAVFAGAAVLGIIRMLFVLGVVLR